MNSCKKHPDSGVYSNGACKDCVKARAREWYKLHSVKDKVNAKIYRDSHKDQLSESKRRWAEENRETLKKKRSDKYLANRKQVLAKCKAYREANRDEVLKRQRARWADNADANAERSLAYRLSHRDELLQKKQEYYRNLKMEVLSHYSSGTPRCQLCPESRLGALCLDHVNGGGTKHRASDNGVRGHAVYNWVKKRGYPKEFQVLCHNCNFRKSLPTEVKNQAQARYVKRIKSSAIGHYSNELGHCAECSMDDLRVLTIDHVNGGGRQEMKKLGIKGGTTFYRHLSKAGFPPGYQVLCFSCNINKHVEDAASRRPFVKKLSSAGP